MAEKERYHTIVIGAGQAGLAAAYYLKKARIDFVVFESKPRIGDVWRGRWNSLRLFTPSKYNSLPGDRFPGVDSYFPTKNEVANYLESYARKNDFPIRFGTPVDSLVRTNGVYHVTSGTLHFSAGNIVVATGPFVRPVIPPLSKNINPAIVQLHSNEYTNPDQLPDGSILVAGAGNSGAEISVDLAREERKVFLAGRDVGNIPADLFGRVLGGRPYWFYVSRVLSVTNPIGRKVREKSFGHGTPLIRITQKDFSTYGITRIPKIVGVREGLPMAQDGRILNVGGIVWATGYKPDFSWIKVPVFARDGMPMHDRGVVRVTPGLYFLGQHFQSSMSSAFIGGVGQDAERVIADLRTRRLVREVLRPTL